MDQLRLTPGESTRLKGTRQRPDKGSAREVLPFPPGGVFSLIAPVAEKMESAIAAARNIERALDDMQRRIDDLDEELELSFSFSAFAGATPASADDTNDGRPFAA